MTFHIFDKSFSFSKSSIFRVNYCAEGFISRYPIKFKGLIICKVYVQKEEIGVNVVNHLQCNYVPIFLHYGAKLIKKVNFAASPNDG